MEKDALWRMFWEADGADMALMVAGFAGSVGDGLAFPAMLVVISRLMNSVGSTVSDGSYHPHLLTNNLNNNALFMCKVAAAAWFFCFLEGYCWTRTAERQASRLRSKYLKAVLRQDVGYFDAGLISVSNIITSVSSDTLIIQTCISEKVPNFLMNMGTFAGCYVVAFILLWRLAIMAIPFLVILVVPGIVYGRMLMSMTRKMREEYDKAGHVVEQAISSIRTVYAFTGESETLSAFSEALKGLVWLGLKQGVAKGFAMGSNGLTFAIWSFNTWYATRLVMYHGAKGGTTFAVGVCINIGGLALGTSLSNLKYFSEALSAGERIKKVINRVPSIDSDDMDGKVLRNFSGALEFRQVEFAYPTRPETLVLCGFSLKVPAGKTVALVGGSGSGKSTVLLLLQRFYNPTRGQILVDGICIDKLQLKWLRSQMGLVSQEPTLFATSIKDNVSFGKEDASMQDVIEAAKASNAHHFITQLPKGYDTMVGERGVQLSGGQKQRIAIARAIIRKPRILLLDEATSALDSRSEHIVQEALNHVSYGTTTIVIAHRLSTIRHAHIISIIQGGQVVEMGSHDELIRLPGSLNYSLQQQQQQQQQQQTYKPKGEIEQQDTHDHHCHQQMETSTITDQTNGGGESFVCEDNKTERPCFKRLVGLNLPEWKMGLLGCLGAMLFGAVQALYSLTMGTMITVFFLSSHKEIKRQTRIFSPCFAGLALVAFIANATQHYSFAYIGEKLTMRIREMMLEKILTFEVGWFDQNENSTGAICSRLANDANAVRCLVGDISSVLVQAASLVLISCIMGLIISWRLAIVMIAVQPLIIFCFYTRRVLLRNMSNKSRTCQDVSSNLAAEAVTNIRVITSFSSQSRILQMLKDAQVAPRQHNIRQSWYTGLGLATSQTLMILFPALNFWYGGKLLLHGYINAKQLFQTVMILERTGRIIADAGSMINDLTNGSNALQSVFTVLDRDTKIKTTYNPSQRPHHNSIMGQIQLQNVDFSYPSRPSAMIFQGFSLDINAGKSTALVGQSGSGKSTVVSLIERFYDPLSGVVKLDGRDIKTYHLQFLRRHMALVSQEPTLFVGTVRDNITYGACNHVEESQVVEAAKIANAHDFISALKYGYNTCCGDKGMQLSGGQKQRIAIARAILRNPRILLLDEATSALDNHSERVVQRALDRVMVGRTCLVVAHRLSTVQNCDIIVVLEKGKIIEIGNHHSLLGKGSSGAYYSLINLQFATYPPPTM